MRQALNSNPMVQIAVLGIVGVLFALIMFTVVLKKDEAPEGAQQPSAKDLIAQGGATGAAPTEAAAAAPVTGDSAASVPASPETESPTAAAAPPATGNGSAAAADGLLPGKGLPDDVLIAYARNKAIALLVVDPKGISDKQVKVYTERLATRGNVEVFVVESKDIADYSRITSGVAVSRAPALVVVRPRDRAGDVPTASVAYGFRGAKSVETALENALYEGGTRRSSPE